MKHDPAAPYFPIYLVVFVLLAITSTLWVHTRTTPQEKKKWFDRSVIVTGGFVVGFMCFVAVLWQQYFIIPFAFARWARSSHL